MVALNHISLYEYMPSDSLDRLRRTWIKLSTKLPNPSKFGELLVPYRVSQIPPVYFLIYPKNLF